MPTRTQHHPNGQHRNSILQTIKIACGRAVRGHAARSMMLLGSRGTAITALLNEISETAQREGLLVSRVESPERKMLSSSLAHLLYPEICKTMQALSDLSLAKPSDNQALQVLSGFMSAFNADMNDVVISADPGREVADSGDLQYDLLDLFASIGRATQVAGKGWLLLVEEVQYLSREDLAALIMAIHHTTQEGLPVLLVGAGLPEVARLAGDAKPYAERLFLYTNVEPVTIEDAISA